MPIKAVIESIDTVAAAYRGLYRKVDAQGDPLAGKFVLDIEAVDGYALAPVENLKTALSSERALRETAEDKLRAFDGIDPNAARTARADHARLSAFDPETEAEHLAALKAELLKADIRREMEKKIAAAQAREGKLLDQIQSLLVTSVLREALRRHGGNAKLLMPLIEKRLRVRENAAGDFIAEVLNDAGVARIKDASGALMSIEDLIVEMKASTDYGLLFASSGPPGGGAEGGSGKGANGDNPWRKESWNVTKQMRLLRDDPTTAARLQRAAAGQPDTAAIDNPWRAESWNVTEQMRLMIKNPAAAERLRRESLQ